MRIAQWILMMNIHLPTCDPSGRAGIAAIARRHMTAVLLAGLISLWPGCWPAAAGDSFDGEFSALKFAGGVLTAYAVHESGHILAAAITGTELTWEAGTYNQPLGFTENAETDSAGLALHSAGLITQAISGEVILQTDRIDKNDDFVRGMMAWNIINPIIYTFDYWFIHRANQSAKGTFQGDIKGVEHYSNESLANGFALSMAAIAAFQGYRYLQTQSWAPEWVKSETHHLSIVPMDSGGFLLGYRYQF
jgi:hypothetical protein